jgi:hypothetical protein
MTTSLWLIKYKDYERFSTILESLELSDVQKQIIRARYLPILHTLQRRATSYSRIYFTGHTIITIGSLFVPALLSIQYSDTGTAFSGIPFQVQIFWATWVISVLVTIFNGILILFKIDKKYYFLHSTLERLRSEGWQYVQLTGRYSGHLIDHKQPTHHNQFIYFCHAVEKIKMKQVNEEYYKNMDKTSQNPSSGQQQSSSGEKAYSVSNEMYVPSPDKELQQLEDSAPRAIRQVLSELIKSNKVVDTRRNSISSIKSSDTLSSYITNSDSTNNTIPKMGREEVGKEEVEKEEVGKEEKNEIILVNATDVESKRDRELIDIQRIIEREKAYEDFINKK